MNVRITDRPAFRLVGHAVRVPLIHEGVNPHIQAHVSAVPMSEHLRLKELSNEVPGGNLQVSDELEPERTEGSELTYLHGVEVTDGTSAPDDLDAIAVPAGTWAVDSSRVIPLQPAATAARPLDRRCPRAQRRGDDRDL